MKYFFGCQTIEDVKARFRDLAKKLHPDCGGDAAEFRAMMDEYRTAFERYKNTRRNMEGQTYERDSNEAPETFSNIINGLVGFEGVVIEIIGSWIWLSGNTKIYKDQIKALGFFWSKSKCAWYYTGEETKSRRRGQYTMDGLREHWGTTVVEPDGRRKIG